MSEEDDKQLNLLLKKMFIRDDSFSKVSRITWNLDLLVESGEDTCAWLLGHSKTIRPNLPDLITLCASYVDDQDRWYPCLITGDSVVVKLSDGPVSKKEAIELMRKVAPNKTEYVEGFSSYPALINVLRSKAMEKGSVKDS